MGLLDLFGLRDLFGTSGALRRADRAAAQGAWARALTLYAAAWKRLSQGRPSELRGAPDARRALLGLTEAARWGTRDSGSGDLGQAVGYCRTARSLGFDDPVFYELPCEHFQAAGGAPTPDALEDLLA